VTSAITSQLEEALSGITQQFKSLAQQMQDLGTALQKLATAGFQATTEGNRLSFIWLQFTRQIAAITLPVVNFLIEKLTQLTQWFRGLSGDGQDLLLKIGGIAAVFTASVAAVSALSIVLSPLALAIGGIATALYVFLTETDMGKGILDGVGNAIKRMVSKWEDIIDVFDRIKFTIGVAMDSVQAVIVGFAVSVVEAVSKILSYIPFLDEMAEGLARHAAEGRKQYAELVESANAAFVPRERKAGGGKGHRDVNPTTSGFESLSASYERITAQANKTDLAKETLDIQKEQLAQQIIIAGGISGLKGGASPPPRGDH